MSFWKTFVKVWEIRASIQIQESLENSFRQFVSNSKTTENIPKIVDELIKKQKSWNNNVSKYRNEIENNE